jgi:hypothetical protein
MSYYKVSIEKGLKKKTFYVAAENMAEVTEQLPKEECFQIERLPITRVHDLRREYERSEYEQPPTLQG